MTAATVTKLRHANRVLLHPQKSQPRRKKGYLTIAQVAEKLKVQSSSIYHHMRAGKITMTKDAGMRCYLFPDKLSTLTQIRQLLNGKIDRIAF